MGIRFSKSIKLGDYVRLNISKSGVSATIGKKGASINVGSKGSYLNLSPTIMGITGTGVSYRKKLTNGFGSLLEKTKNIENDKITANDDIQKIIEEYNTNLNESMFIHKCSDKVLSLDELDKKNSEQTNKDIKQIYELSNSGDEETIESLIGSFMLNFDFVYPVKANYELEDSILYVDLDLPEIEDIDKEYPDIVKNSIVNKNKSQSQIKQEYANTVVSLSIYLSGQFFNLSSFIKQIIISGFTTKRNANGDLQDVYLYSIKYLRDVFENTDLTKIDDIYEFVNRFENRININTSSYTFKGIKPYEMPSVEKSNSLIDDAIKGLKELGYKNVTINEIVPKLNELELKTSADYLKAGLKLILENK